MVSLNDVLLAYSNIPVDDPIAEIWGRELQGGHEIIEYTGTLPITITADGSTFLDYKIYGNTVQDGTPTPENPVEVVGCGERTENVMPSAPAETKTNNGITITCDGNGVYTLSGTALISANVVFRLKDFTIPISVGQGGQGTMSLFNTAPSGQLSMAFLNGNTSIDAWFINSRNRKSNTYSTMSGAVCNAIQFLVPSGNNCDCVIKPCFTNDSIYPATYIPYGYKLPILSNSAVTNIYLGEVQTTRRIKKLVLTGEENGYTKNVANPSDYLYYIIVDAAGIPKAIPNNKSICTHLKYGAYNQGDFSFSYSGNILYFNFGSDIMNAQPSGNTVKGLKEYLAAQYAAGTPVTIWYVLAEPETAVVNEPLMKIGDYVDTLTMEQADVSIPTIAGATVIDYDGAPKPSQMYIKYRR